MIFHQEGKGNIFSWKIGPKYTAIKVIGEGAYGSVILAVHNSSQKPVAIKKIHNVFGSALDTFQILREIKALKKLKHVNIIKLLDLFLVEEATFDLFMVMEYYPYDLFSLLESKRFLPTSYIQKIMYGLMNGIAFLHSAGIVHRDIKPSNILLSMDGDIRICDFDLSRPITKIYKNIEDIIKRSISSNNKSKIHTFREFGQVKHISYLNSKFGSPSFEAHNNSFSIKDKKQLAKALRLTRKERGENKRSLSPHVITRWYRPPEIILFEKNYDYAIDVWSAGCIFAELLQMTWEYAACSKGEQRIPIFMGDFCFPLSPPDPKEIDTRDGILNDQLGKILSTLGSQDEDGSSFVTSTNALNYLKRFSLPQGTKLRERMAGISDDAFNLLSRMLEFNPYFRITAYECLKDPFFSNTVDKLDFYPSEHVINFDDFDNDVKLDPNILKEILINEIKTNIQKI